MAMLTLNKLPGEDAGTAVYFSDVSRKFSDKSGGIVRSLRNMDLDGLDFKEFDGCMNFENCSMKGINLSTCRISSSILSGCDLTGANLRDTEFYHSDIYDSTLNGADFTDSGTDDLSFYSCNRFEGVILKGTCYDPDIELPHVTDEQLKSIGLTEDPDNSQKVWGYRTFVSQYHGEKRYEAGGHIAPVFSTSSNECHPGIYIASREYLLNEFEDRCHVRCWTLRKDLLIRGNKARTRKLVVTEVLGRWLPGMPI